MLQTSFDVEFNQPLIQQTSSNQLRNSSTLHRDVCEKTNQCTFVYSFFTCIYLYEFYFVVLGLILTFNVSEFLCHRSALDVIHVNDVFPKALSHQTPVRFSIETMDSCGALDNRDQRLLVRFTGTQTQSLNSVQ